MSDARTSAGRLLSRKQLHSMKRIKATKKDPYRKPGTLTRTVVVNARAGASLAPTVQVERIKGKRTGPSMWQVKLEVQGVISDHLPGQGVHRHPRRQRDSKSLIALPVHQSFRPLWRDVSFTPATRPRPIPQKLQWRGREYEPLIVFPDDSRKVLTDTSWPWLLVGRIFTSDGKGGSGVLIGDRLVLTARHVLPWDSINRGSWWMRFVPHFFDGVESFGSSFTSDVRYYDIEDEDFRLSHDYAVMRLYDPLGSQLGYMGCVAEFDDDWRGIGLDNVGYHQDIAGASEPAWQIYPIEDDYEDDDGQTLETEASLDHGSSGSPFFAWFDMDGGTDVRVVGVVGGALNAADDLDNSVSGGPNLADLVRWGRDNWPL